MTMAVAGINLGASGCSVAVYYNNCYDVIANEDGNLRTASFVAFEEEQLIGEEAKRGLKVDATRVVFDVKQIIGRQFNDRLIQLKLNQWPFDVIEGEDKKPRIQVKYKGEFEIFTPEQILSKLISKMKSIAESECDQEVVNAIISVPSFFDTQQRQSTLNAAKDCGFKCVRLINDTTAIAISYFNHILLQRDIKTENVLIFDIGATSFEVSAVEITPGNIKVKSTSGSCEFGGNDFDERLMCHLISKFSNKYQCDIKHNQKAVQRLRCYCEEAKIQLSRRNVTRILIDHLLPGMNFDETITRQQFETICGDLFNYITSCVQTVVSDANLEMNGITDIIVVGGGSKMPKIPVILRDMFPEGTININASLNSLGDCIAIGAALQGSIEKVNNHLMGLKIRSIIPYSMGIETKNGIMRKIVTRNAEIPQRHKKCFKVNANDQKEIKVKVFKGETVLTKYNQLIDEITFTFDSLNVKNGNCELELDFNVDMNGLLTVTSAMKFNLKQNKTEICSAGKYYTLSF